jgi:PPOX class probable F420-dependent enzyme
MGHTASAPSSHRAQASGDTPAIPGKYLSITSFKRDGTGIATPVWFVQEAGRLLTQTDASSYKVKRIRRNPRVMIAPCTATGRLRAGPVTARAEVLPGDELGRVKELIARKYQIDLIFIKPIRSLQAVLRHGQPPAQEIALAITRSTPGSPRTSPAWRPTASSWRPARKPREGAFAHETR